MKANDRVAESIHRRRTGRGLTMRDVEHLTQRLALQDSERYEPVSRGTISNLENEGADYFERRSRTLSLAKLNSIIELLYEGDLNLWTQETGVSLSPATEDVDLLRPRPLYVEGGEATAGAVRAGQGALREQVPALPWADVLVEVTSNANAPLVWPGQIVGVTLTSMPVFRGLNLLVRRGHLVLAWQVRPGEYAVTTGDARAFGLGPKDAVVGHVRWITPELPALRAG